MSLTQALNDQVINGDGTSPNFNGVYNRVTIPSANPSAATEFSAYVSAPSSLVDGKYASDENAVSILVKPAVYAHMGGLFATGTAVNAISGVRATGTKLMASDFLRSAANNAYVSLTHRAGTGRTDSVLAIWNTGLEFIRDPYTGAASGHVAIRAAVYGDFNVIRPEAYGAVKFRVS